MNSKLKSLSAIFLFLCIANTYGSRRFVRSDRQLTHKISIIHPGISLQEKVNCELVEVISSYSTTSSFYMDVESVVCGSKECKIVSVRVHWNALGEFTNLELRNGITLEKNEGIEFSKEDYQKLDLILKDKASPLQTYYKYELVSTNHANAMDAFSGATVEIDKSAVVEGAVWTCYTLWYWANGGVVDAIRNITSQKYTNQQLQQLVLGSNQGYQIFALEELIKRKSYSEISVAAISKIAQKSKELFKLSIAYFEKSNDQLYFRFVSETYKESNEYEARGLLNSLMKTKFEYPTGFFEEISDENINRVSYQEIDLFLTLLDAKAYTSGKIQTNTCKLLEHSEFLISRRAYWYLKKYQLNEENTIKLNSFKEKNKNKL